MAVPLNQCGYQELTVGATAVGLTRPTANRPHHALIGVAGGAIRWLAIPPGSTNYQAPTNSVGSFVGAGGTIDWTDPERNYAALIDNVTFIRAGVNDAKLEVSYFW